MTGWLFGLRVEKKPGLCFGFAGSWASRFKIENGVNFFSAGIGRPEEGAGARG